MEIDADHFNNKKENSNESNSDREDYKKMKIDMKGKKVKNIGKMMGKLLKKKISKD